MSEHEFKVGDFVLSIQCGFAEIRQSPLPEYPLKVGDRCYTVEGLFRDSDKFPSLLTVEQAAKLGFFPEKKKVKKTMYQVVFKLLGFCTYNLSNELFQSEHTAREYFKSDFISMGPAIEFEVEE